MYNISAKFNRPLPEVHTIFYEVSCDRDRLIQILEADSKKKGVPSDIKRWQTLEDLALRHSEDTPSFKVVLSDKGRDEVEKRKAFLEI
mmetsp:Transcript_17492/g.23614  ORF Transcript_17492/g.23614 Transcript_17492/m.23614 type:complete len:88 (-) Transcript_17492:249-512(-)